MRELFSSQLCELAQIALSVVAATEVKQSDLCRDPVLSDTKRYITALALMLLQRASIDDLARATKLSSQEVEDCLLSLIEHGFARVREDGMYELTEEGILRLVAYTRTLLKLYRELNCRDYKV